MESIITAIISLTMLGLGTVALGLGIFVSTADRRSPEDRPTRGPQQAARVLNQTT